MAIQDMPDTEPAKKATPGVDAAKALREPRQGDRPP
jgi:hypothetical protein